MEVDDAVELARKLRSEDDAIPSGRDMDGGASGTVFQYRADFCSCDVASMQQTDARQLQPPFAGLPTQRCRRRDIMNSSCIKRGLFEPACAGSGSG